MAITKVIRSKNSQAVGIPKKPPLPSQHVETRKHRDKIVLSKRPTNLGAAFVLLAGLSPDFFKGGRRQPKRDKRARG